MVSSIYNTVFGGNLVAPAIPTYLALNIAANVILGWPLESNITAPSAAEIIDVTASVANLTVQLSDARQVSTGYCALFNNVGANTFSVLDAQGNTLMSVASGQAWQIYISDNSTLQGTWRVFQYGAGVSSANAAALAGLGLKAITTTLNERIVINPQGANYTIQATDRAACIEWTGGAGGTLTLPNPATVGSDWFCYIKNSGTGIVTITPPSGQVDGTANKTFNPNDSAIVATDGVNFITMGYGQSVASSFNFVTISLAGDSGNIILNGAQLNRISYKFTGALAGNTTVVVPASIQQYWVDNETTGSFTLTISAGGIGATYTVPQATRVILYCDGLNIVNAITSGGIQFADGTAAAPSITFASDLTLGLYKAGADVLGVSTAGVQRVTVNASGQVTINAPSSGIGLTVTGGGGVAVQANGALSSRAIQFDSTSASGVYAAWSNSGSDIGYLGAASPLGTGTAADFALRAQANFFILTNGTVVRVAVNTSGNITINAPSSGSPLTINGTTGGGGFLSGAVSVNSAITADFQNTNTGAAANTFIRAINSADAVAFGISSTGFSGSVLSGGPTGESGYIYVSANLPFSIGTNATERIRIAGTGAVTVNAPGSGVAFTATGPSGNFAGQFFGSGAAGSNFGVDIDAGGNSSDISFQVRNSGGSSTYFKINGAGLVQAVDDGGTLQAVGWRGLPINTQSTNYAPALSDRGKMIQTGSSVTYTLNTGIFSGSDSYAVRATSGATLTIAQGAGFTLSWGGNGATTGNRTLTGEAIATIWYSGGSSATIQGPGLT